MEKVRPWCGQPSDRGRLRTGQDCHIATCNPWSSLLKIIIANHSYCKHENATSFNELPSQHKCTGPSGTCIVYLHKHTPLTSHKLLHITHKLETTTKSAQIPTTKTVLDSYSFFMSRHFSVTIANQHSQKWPNNAASYIMKRRCQFR